MPFKLAGLLIIVVFGVFAISAVTAGAWNAGTITITCTSFIDNGVAVVRARDNTGLRREAYTIETVDGADTVLAQVVSDAALGGLYTIGGQTYSVMPQYNPITFRLISHAGNGFEEQLIYSVIGNCEGLPFLSMCDLNVLPGSVVGEAPNGA